jgi:hypothetical protein
MIKSRTARVKSGANDDDGRAGLLSAIDGAVLARARARVRAFHFSIQFNARENDQRPLAHASEVRIISQLRRVEDYERPERPSAW